MEQSERSTFGVGGGEEGANCGRYLGHGRGKKR